MAFYSICKVKNPPAPIYARIREGKTIDAKARN